MMENHISSLANATTHHVLIYSEFFCIELKGVRLIPHLLRDQRYMDL